ncbi:MAG: hypothetical protein HOL56_00780 [Flavobacteriales bacterium]|jgi:hypothetical protein|nr:hypothetical protein [Flavobacteriales bacterium]MBT5771392.1 hypothetical protein [Flavobacteriaceae bacterium]MBT7620105.1 hypothetical protein [Flavobacteriales bacterium]
MKKSIIILGSFFFLTLILSSCGGSEDATENGEKAGKCDCKRYELEIERWGLMEEQLEYWDKKDREIDDRQKWAELQLDILDIGYKISDLDQEVETYSNQVYAGENWEDEDDVEEWMEDFDDAREDYVDDNCEDQMDDAEDAYNDYQKQCQKDNYYGYEGY